MDELLEKYEAKLAEVLADFNSDYEAQYYEGCDRADMAIKILTELVEDIKARKKKELLQHIVNNEKSF